MEIDPRTLIYFIGELHCEKRVYEERIEKLEAELAEAQTQLSTSEERDADDSNSTS